MVGENQLVLFGNPPLKEKGNLSLTALKLIEVAFIYKSNIGGTAENKFIPSYVFRTFFYGKEDKK